jgi:hypothetical protein
MAPLLPNAPPCSLARPHIQRVQTSRTLLLRQDTPNDELELRMRGIVEAVLQQRLDCERPPALAAALAKAEAAEAAAAVLHEQLRRLAEAYEQRLRELELAHAMEAEGEHACS